MRTSSRYTLESHSQSGQVSENELNPFDLTPVFRIGLDQVGTSLEDHLRSQPLFSLAKLAATLAPRVLRSDFLPDCPWANISRLRAQLPPRSFESNPLDLEARFHLSVKACMDTADTIAIALSGGMDSAAVLRAAGEIAERDNRHLIALTVDIVDDSGVSAYATAARVIEGLGARCKHVRIPAEPTRFQEPPWTFHGPRFDAEPRYRRGLHEYAADEGAQVILTGHGADQLLRMPRFLLTQPRRMKEGFRVYSYLRHHLSKSKVDLAHEIVARTMPKLNSHTAQRLYMVLAWSILLDDPPPILTPWAKEMSQQWTTNFILQQMTRYETRGYDWASAYAEDLFFPLDQLLPCSEIQELSPFLQSEFLQFAHNIPLTYRFNPELPSPYFREKALLLSLLPQESIYAIPPYRQRAYRAFSTYWFSVADSAPRLRALGFLRDDWESIGKDAFELAKAMSCESWVRGAEKRGAVPLEIQ